MITLFSTAKRFEGHTAVIQENALDSWCALGPSVEVILFGDDPGTAEAAQRRGLRHVPDVKRTEQGTPLLSDIFDQAREKAKNPVLAYINADIVLRPDFVTAIGRVVQERERFLVVVQRLNLDVTTRLSFDDRGWAELGRCMRREGKLEAPDGIDVFAFSKATALALPDFAVGRPCWDNWLIMQAKRLGIPVVDISAVCRIVHQNHGYRHVPQGKGNKWEGPEADANRALAAIETNDFRAADYTILSADECLDEAGLRPMPRFWVLVRRLRHHPLWPEKGYVKIPQPSAMRMVVQILYSVLVRLYALVRPYLPYRLHRLIVYTINSLFRQGESDPTDADPAREKSKDRL
ncbi:glycosyltransferase family A protein [Rhodospira trueperi]|uniref:Glycosyl transferase family 2 n=1 Tax=Rhodospira trueperi TaxID=69960 RepID=A0A1G7GRM6_9PROT|nr:glycosyltransferase family A protein [Rhodospira trueperi]SDE90619.1 hypothetical protein SAMN05421720_11561 [Rhodospira trueperi]